MQQLGNTITFDNQIQPFLNEKGWSAEPVEIVKLHIGLLGSNPTFEIAPNSFGTIPSWMILLEGAELQTDPSPIPESYYNYQPLIDMQGAPNSSQKTAEGWNRNNKWFWKERLNKNPEMFSSDNKYKIQVQQKSPIVDDTWVAHNPTHASFKGQVLEHHHVDQGQYAVALPKEIHKKWSKVLHQRFKGGSSGLKGKANIKLNIKGFGNALGAAGLFIDAAGYYSGDPHNFYIILESMGNGQLGKVYYDETTNSYLTANQKADWDVPPTSGPHKDWKRVVWVSQYMDYAWDEEQGKYVGIGLLAEGYQVYYKDGSHKNVTIRCYGVDWLECPH
jgi:hypothetical protein